MGKKNPDVRLAHFNDVYHIAPQFQDAPIPGGAARFVSLLQKYRNGEKYTGSPDLVTVFSGDAFSPSMESSVTHGLHMVDIMSQDHLAIDVAVYGNHDFDFGIDQLIELKNKCKFPWLVSNLFIDGKPIAQGLEYYIHEVSGVRIGFVGLIEREWVLSIRYLPPHYEYRSVVKTSLKLVPKLRNELNCDLVIAITHQREPNDIKLAERLPPGTFDLILGGHDHFYSHKIANGTDILTSGTDFRTLSYIEGFKDSDSGKWKWDIIRCDATKSIPEDERTLKLVDSISGYMNKKLDMIIGWTAVPLDSTFETMRSSESNFASFIADVMRYWYDTDISLLAGGSFRSDLVYPAGPIRMKDLVLAFPFEDPCVVVSLSGKEVLEALETGVSKLPALEGRFLQVSGIRYKFCLDASPRIISAEVNGEPINSEKQYTCATFQYMVDGNDGFQCLMVPLDRVIVDSEQGIILPQMLRMWFQSIKLFQKWHNGTSSSAPEKLDSSQTSHETFTGTESNTWRQKLKRLVSDGLHMVDLSQADQNEAEQEKDLSLERKVLEVWQNGKPINFSNGSHQGIAPQIEDRIVQLDLHGQEI
ncbi:Metallo-dependent phosphatase-like protein [Lipomyces japonicus]|uniref:Metallo-dependent phosphatase-like protein n=1 Tax=Lipomyces japonicus TaxID=56871 RepID=UPI0034CECCFB